MIVYLSQLSQHPLIITQFTVCSRYTTQWLMQATLLMGLVGHHHQVKGVFLKVVFQVDRFYDLSLKFVELNFNFLLFFYLIKFKGLLTQFMIPAPTVLDSKLTHQSNFPNNQFAQTLPLSQQPQFSYLDTKW
jgi:hypothetical protein